MKISHPFEHSPGHEALLLRSLTARRPELPHDLQSCPRCREEFQEATAVMDVLADMARDDHAAIARSLTRPPEDGPVPGAGLVEPYFRARFAERQRRPLVRGRRLALRWAAAAAAVLTFGWGARLYVSADAGDAPGRVLLGSESATVLTPRGPGSSFEVFRWEGIAAPRGASYVVEILDKESRLVAESPRLDTTSWRPDPAEAAGWPDEIRWSVRVSAPGFQIQAPGATAVRGR